MEQNIFLQEYFKTIDYLYQLKKIKYFNKYFSTTRIELQKSNGMSEKINKNITKSDSNFGPYFVDHQLLPDMNSNGYFVVKNNISIT